MALRNRPACRTLRAMWWAQEAATDASFPTAAATFPPYFTSLSLSLLDADASVTCRSSSINWA